MEVISSQSKVRNCQCKYNTAAKFPPKFGPSQQNVSFATFQLLLVSRYHVKEEIYDLDILSDSDGEKEKYFRGRDTATQRDLSTTAIF